MSDAGDRHLNAKENSMISELIHRLEQSLAYARIIQADVDGDPDTWSDERWEEAHRGFEHAFSLAIAEAQREEMWPPFEPTPAPERLMVPSLERAEEIITEWAGVRTIHDAGGATMYDTTGVIVRPKCGQPNPSARRTHESCIRHV
jgi:hypothetical protein